MFNAINVFKRIGIPFVPIKSTYIYERKVIELTNECTISTAAAKQKYAGDNLNVCSWFARNDDELEHFVGNGKNLREAPRMRMKMRTRQTKLVDFNISSDCTLSLNIVNHKYIKTTEKY